MEMDPLLHLFCSRLVMNDNRSKAFSLASEDLMYYHQTLSAAKEQFAQQQPVEGSNSEAAVPQLPVADSKIAVPVQSVAEGHSIPLTEAKTVETSQSPLDAGGLSLLLDEVLGKYKSSGLSIKSEIMAKILSRK